MSRTSAGTGSKEISKQAAGKSQSTANMKSKPATSRKSNGDGMDRKEMISVAAYFRAEHRGFDGMDPMEDWLAAEAEIDEMLKNCEDINVH